MSTLKTLTKAELVALLQERNATIEALRLDLSVAKVAKPLAPLPIAVASTVAKIFTSGGKTWAKVRIGFNQFAVREVHA